MYEIIESTQIFIEKGGVILYALLFLTFILWMMLSERFIYILFVAKSLKAVLLNESKIGAKDGWKIAKVREYCISKYSLSLRDNLSLIKILIVIAPFLGLLGTVMGMIEIFDVMAYTGSDDAKSMASGVSRATIPTLCGMVISISGLFFINLYENRVKLEIQNLREKI